MTDEEIILTYGNTVYAIAVNYVRSRYDADDVYSETFLHYFRKKRHFENEEHRKAYLIRLAINCSKDFLISKKRHSNSLIEEKMAISEDETANDEVAFLRETLESLQPEERNLIYLFYYQNMKSADIAKLSGVSDDAVRSKLKRIREKIKNILTH